MRAGYDVIVVGGGFAGLTAARDLSHQGYAVLLLEGRDRLGGRTWTSQFGHSPVEMGGTWVHWFQPHVWAEISRYRIGVSESPWPQTCHWIANDELHQSDPDTFNNMLSGAIDQFCDDARRILPRPYDPLYDPAAARSVDPLSVAERLAHTKLDSDSLAILDGQLSTMGSCFNSEAGLLPLALKWYALSGWNTMLMWDCIARYKLVGGTRALIGAMVRDATLDIKLLADVDAVGVEPASVTVSCRSGESYRARAAVLALPINVMDRVTVTPALVDPVQEIISAHQASHGVKVWVEIEGIHDPICCVAPDSHALTWLQTEYTVPGKPGSTLMVGFGPAGESLRPDDLAAVRAAISVWLPDSTVLSSGGHSWSTDPFSLGTWPVLRPGQLTGSLLALQSPHGRLVLAGSETASGWNGFIDGAIESGHRAAHQISAMLT